MILNSGGIVYMSIRERLVLAAKTTVEGESRAQEDKKAGELHD